MDSVSTKKIAAVVIILAVLCAYTWSLRLRTVPLPPAPDLEAVPRTLDGRTARDEFISPGSLDLLGADLTLARSYAGPAGGSIDLFIGYFAAQQEYSQIHSPKHCYPGAGWDIISEGSVDIDVGGERSPVRRLMISDGGNRQLVVYWFSMRGRTIRGEFALKWHQMTSALLGRSQAASFVRFSAVIPPGEDAAVEANLIRFVESISPHISGALKMRGDEGDDEQGS
jgi:EpsI family protein